MADYLFYLKPTTSYPEKVDYTASNQFSEIQQGDTIWIVRMSSGCLVLGGRLAVARCVGRRTAERALGSEDLWDARYYALTDTPEPWRQVDITGLALRLRFDGDVDRLPLKFTGKNLQSIRTLTSDAAGLLEVAWSSVSTDEDLGGQPQSHVIHDDCFSREFKAFREFVEERSSGVPLVSFEWNDYIKNQENYKYDIYEQGRKRLSFPKWKNSDIGSGNIKKAVDSAIRLPGNKNNLIDWRIQSHWQSVPDIGDLERECYALYRTNNDRETFDHLVGLLGRRYELIAYLFFLKDRSRYLPIRPTRFDKVFKLLGMEFRTSKQCGWDNYATYIGLMRELAELLSDRLGSEVTLLDAHSFSWILGSQMQENKEEVPVVPPGGDEGQQFAEARRMHHERMEFVRKRALATAVKKRDHYKCVVCHFSPSLRYGQAHRTTALDCHHLKPLANRYDHTQSHSTLEDVATVCSNCHRLLHSDRKTLSLDQARNLLVVRES